MKRSLFIPILLAAGCVSGATTDVPTTPLGPFSTVTAELRDSTMLPAGTSITVRAHVAHAGLPLVGVAVGWSVLAGHGKVSAASTTTDSLGVASVQWVLSDTAGLNTLAIASGDGADTLHLIGAVGEPSALVVVSPESNTISVSDSVSLQVRVVDRPGNPVAHAAVNWSATGGSVLPASTVSDATGIAGAVFRASQPGTYQVTADLPERASVVFKVTVR